LNGINFGDDTPEGAVTKSDSQWSSAWSVSRMMRAAVISVLVSGDLRQPRGASRHCYLIACPRHTDHWSVSD